MPAPAYVILCSKVTDPEAFQQYLASTPPTLAAHSGEYVVRGGEKVVLEGDWDPARVVVLRFPSMAQARAWYEGDGYTAARQHRHGATAYFNVLLVEGYGPQ